MIEFPEAIALARQLNDALAGKRISSVLPATSLHKFCWTNGSIEDYRTALTGRSFVSAAGFGSFVEMDFDGVRLCISEGVSPRLYAAGEKIPAKYQLAVAFSDGCTLLFTVSMYGGIYCHDGALDNSYYQTARSCSSVLTDAFTPQVLESMIASVRPSTSLKGLLATEQRIPGLGNGVLQDILLNARLHPRRTAASLTDAETRALYQSIRSTLSAMAGQGGRDTQRDLYGNPCGYRTLLCKSALSSGCPVCGGPVTKETYLGGAIYFCAACQPLTK